MKRLSPLQRGYIMGLRRARAKAQREMDDMCDQFEGVLGEIREELRGIRDETQRQRAIEEVASVVRDPTMLLN
jgi:hypothetical protein